MPGPPPSDHKIWVDIVSACANSIIAIVAVFGGSLRRWWYRPKLILDHANPKSRGITTTNGTGATSVQVIYYLLKVENQGRGDAATNCKVYIEKFERQNTTGGYDGIELPVRIQLVWAPGFQNRISLDVKDKEYIDFFTISENNGYFCTHSNQWDKYPISKNTRLRVGLRIVSDNYISQIITYHIHWDGVFAYDAYKMLDHLKIMRTEQTAD